MTPTPRPPASNASHVARSAKVEIRCGPAEQWLAEVRYEPGMCVVTLPWPAEGLDSMKMIARERSLRLWRLEGDETTSYEILFHKAMEPKAMLVRLQNGVLELIIAQQETRMANPP